MKISSFIYVARILTDLRDRPIMLRCWWTDRASDRVYG